MMIEERKHFILILILGFLSAIGPFSIDMYLPGFPAMAKDLHTSVDAVSYSLSSFFIGISVGQLFCGPLLDRYGRKGPLVIGLLLYLLASIGCALSRTIEMLIVFRLLQALGGCVTMVAPRAIVRDVFPVKENAKILSLLILVLGVSPILAPTVGSFVIAELGWNYVFIVLAVVSIFMLLTLIFWFTESRPPDPSFSLRPAPILASFKKVLSEPQFYTYALAGGVASAGLFAYLAGSPFVFMNYFGVSEKQYGGIFALIAAGLIGSSQLNNFLLRKYSSEQIMKTILILQSIIGILLVSGSIYNMLDLYGTIFLMFLFLSCQGFTFPNSAALSMAPFSKEAGSASALMGAIQMGLGSLASTFVGLLNAQNPIPMISIMAGCTLVGLLFLFIGRNRIRYAASKQDVEEQVIELL